jgi:hypothetical protein
MSSRPFRLLSRDLSGEVQTMDLSNTSYRLDPFAWCCTIIIIIIIIIIIVFNWVELNNSPVLWIFSYTLVLIAKTGRVLVCMRNAENTPSRGATWSVGDFLAIELGGALQHDPITVAHVSTLGVTCHTELYSNGVSNN